jgi:hypothetical protein
MTNSQSTILNSFISALKAHPAATTKDVAQCWGNSVTFGLTLQCANIAALTGTVDNCLEIFSRAPQKQVKNTAKFLNCLAHNTVTKHDATHARELLALYLNATENNKGVRYSQLGRVGANTRIGADNDQSLRERINKLFPQHHGQNTESTKRSNAFGDNGQFTLLGITWGEPRKHNKEVIINTQHPLLQMFIKQVNNATDAQLKELFSKDSE